MSEVHIEAIAEMAELERQRDAARAELERIRTGFATLCGSAMGRAVRLGFTETEAAYALMINADNVIAVLAQAAKAQAQQDGG